MPNVYFPCSKCSLLLSDYLRNTHKCIKSFKILRVYFYYCYVVLCFRVFEITKERKRESKKRESMS